MTASCWSGLTRRIATSLTARVFHTDIGGDLVRRPRRAVAGGVRGNATVREHPGARGYPFAAGLEAAPAVRRRGTAGGAWRGGDRLRASAPAPPAERSTSRFGA